MKEVLIKNIREIVQVRDQVQLIKGRDLENLPVLENGWLLISGGKIHSLGSMETCPEHPNVIEATGRFLLPAFVDSHTHIIFAASRESEFVQKILGKSYADIAASGGGILNSAARLQSMSEEELFERSYQRVLEVMNHGTGTIEIKSGYGLTVKDELKMLRVARRIGEKGTIKVKSTFLGAHAFPGNVSREKYITQIKEEMIPLVAGEKLASYMDIFCETGFFTKEESVDLLETGKKYGLIPKVHANQLNLSGGVQAGVKTGAISVDHLETVSQVELDLLQHSNVIPTLLPGAAFFLRSPYPPARKMVDMGLPLAVASDYNPGSSPTGNMQTIWSLACIGMKMTPREAFNAMTINTAFAINMESQSGIIAPGRDADLILTKEIPSFDYIPYSFGENCFERVFIKGQEQ